MREPGYFGMTDQELAQVCLCKHTCKHHALVGMQKCYECNCTSFYPEEDVHTDVEWVGLINNIILGVMKDYEEPNPYHNATKMLTSTVRAIIMQTRRVAFEETCHILFEKGRRERVASDHGDASRESRVSALNISLVLRSAEAHIRTLPDLPRTPASPSPPEDDEEFSEDQDNDTD